MLLYAHRGAHQTHPENTLEAFEAAIAQGADGVELDVRTCGSGEVVVAHDPHFGRVAGRAAWVAHMPWAALRELESDADVLLVELSPAVVAWNRGLLADLLGFARGVQS